MEQPDALIKIFNTYISPLAQLDIAKLLESTFLSEGEVVRNFERKLESDLGLQNCVALNSGTSALHLALIQAGIREGDEVILPAQTFVASGLAILYQKAVPVFADIDYMTGNISAASVRSKISPRTKAILVVHWGGYPCDLDELGSIAMENKIYIIEDAAHALGATYKGKTIGSISPYTCFSFQAIKHLTTGDGGALCVKDANDLRASIAARWFGIDRANAPLTDLGERSYNIRQIGYKYHMNNYAAALGLANLQSFKERLANRISIANFYRSRLSEMRGTTLFDYSTDRESAYWLFGLHVEKRMDFIRAMHSRGIETSVVHQRIDRNDVFGLKSNDLINQAKFDETQIHIPIHDGINGEKSEYIVTAIEKGW